MIYFLRITLLGILVILGIASAAQSETGNGADKLTILTENSGEDNYIAKDGQVAGHNVEIVREIMKRLGKEYPIEPIPWARGYHMALNDPNTMLFTTTRIADREKLFKWVGPLHVSRYIFYGRKDYQKEIKTIDDARNVPAIGCVGEDVRQKILLKKGFKNLEPYFGLNANSQNLKKLMAGRIDLWISSPKELIETAKGIGIEQSELKEVLSLANYFNYMAFSIKTPDETVEKWQKTLDEIKADGTYAKIMSKYVTGPPSMTFDKPGPAKD